ncbi:DUF397 domain-containing protein [Saccharopolyspora cebuensis]|uniref:DUF397 domain-containing protein n=1 Tax=Saccharopolyspora cebuensis TaxID=418759 RepID=A0ABV4CJU3_9PSEU
MTGDPTAARQMRTAASSMWQVSSYSGPRVNCVEVCHDFAGWRKSSHSGAEGDCVEVGTAPGVVGVRDSKHRDGAVLVFGRASWQRFITAMSERS